MATLLERLCDEGDKKEDQLEKELFVRDIMGVAYGGDYDNCSLIFVLTNPTLQAASDTVR